MNSTPPEMWDKILSYLSLRDLKSCSRLNKQLRRGTLTILDKLSKVSLLSQAKLDSYIDYLSDGGRLHKHILLVLKTKELAENEIKYRKILAKIYPSVRKCMLISDALSTRISDNLLHQIFNLSPNFNLVLNPNTCPEYILQYLITARLAYLKSIEIMKRSEGFNQTKQDSLEKILSSSINLRGLVLHDSEHPNHPMEWPLTFLASLSGARLEKISSIGLITEKATLPEILQDRRLKLKDIEIRAYFSAKIFNGAAEQLIIHHSASIEQLKLMFPSIKDLEEIPNFQLPVMPKLRNLDLLSRREDSSEFPPYFPTLPANFPPFLKRIRIMVQFHNQKMLETQLKAVFRHHWSQPGAKFPQVNYIVIVECFSIHPKCRERVGSRILLKLIKMFPNAEIRIIDQKFKQDFFISPLGKREKWNERSR